MDYLVEFYSVSKSYKGSYALRDLNLGLQRGRCIGILGPEGAGKTAFCNLLSGVESPDCGELLFDGKKIKARTKKRISYLPQKSFIRNFRKVSELMSFYGCYFADFDRNRAVELMRIFGISPENYISSDRGLNELISISCFAARRADMYVLDEPLAYFDRDERQNFLKTALQGFDNRPLIVIAARHLRGIAPLLDDVVLLHEGKTKLIVSAEEIREKTGMDAEGLYKEVFTDGIV